MLRLFEQGFFLAENSQKNRTLLLLSYVPAIIIAFLGSIFMYRHTAQRRKLQAILTGGLTLIFWFLGLIALLTQISIWR